MSDLFTLAQQNRAEELRALLNKGVGAKAADDHGRSLLHHAAASNAKEVVDLLLERGASFELTDMYGYTVRPPLVQSLLWRLGHSKQTRMLCTFHGALASPKSTTFAVQRRIPT